MKKTCNAMKKIMAYILLTALIITCAPVAMAETFSAIVTSSSMAVYNNSSLSKKLGTLKKGTVVQVTDYSGKIAKIKYNGKTGFAKIAAMDSVEEIAEKAIVNTKSKVYQSAKTTSKYTAVKKGTELYILATKNNWAQVEKDGKVGYMNLTHLTIVDDFNNPIATATPSPKPTATPEPEITVKVFSAYATEDVKVYKKASTASTCLGTLKKGQIVTVGAYSDNGWAYIRLNGKYGYCQFASLAKTDATPVPAATATPTPKPTEVPDLSNAIDATVTSYELFVYKSASTASDKLAALQKGSKVNVIEWNNIWAYVEANGCYGYCKISGLTKTSELQATPKPTEVPDLSNAVEATVTVTKLAVYKKASTSSTKLGHVYKGEEVNVLKWNGTWAYIEMNGKYGYCKISGLTKTSELEAATPTPTPTATPTPEPTATPTPKPTATPDTSNAVEGTVTVKKLAVYQKASTASKKLGHIYKGEEVNVLKWNSTWAYIEMNGKYGYCKISGLTKTSELEAATPTPTIAPTATPSIEDAIKATVTTDKIPVYKTASTASTKLGHVYRGEEVNVLQWNDVWAYIEMDGKYGFCSIKGLTKTSELENATPAPTATPNIKDAVDATVTADSVNVYKTASTSSARLATLKKGTTVKVISCKDDWAYITKDGSFGFCKLSALTKTSELEEDKLPAGYTEGGFTATVLSADAKVYASASTDAKSVTLTQGQTVNVYAYSDSWACIVQGKEYGFVQIKYLSKTAYETVKESGDAMHTILKALLTYGYYDQIPSTTYNTNAANAIKRFQKDCGLTQSGEADVATQRILFSDYAPRSSILSKTLKSGDKGTNVGRMQTRLYALGYLSKTTSVDSDFGSTTKEAVKLFQNANGMTPSGEADVKTLKELYSTGAIKKPSNVKAADATSSSTGGSTSGTSWTLEMPSSLASFTTSKGSTVDSKIEYLIYVGQNQLGKPYIYGTEGPNSYDCSGFTQYCFKKVGITLKRSAYSQGYDKTYEKITSPSSLKRGDLVYFNTITDSDLSDHAGIYLGKGYFIHASSGGEKVVVSNLNSGYYSRVFSWGHRPLQ